MCLSENLGSLRYQQKNKTVQSDIYLLIIYKEITATNNRYSLTLKTPNTTIDEFANTVDPDHNEPLL